MTDAAGVLDETPGLARRMAAIVYDSLLLFSLLFAATGVLLIFRAGEAIPPNNALYTAYLLGVSFFYFGWCWTRGGQTLGMAAWRLRALDRAGGPLTWMQSLARFTGAMLSWSCLGLGFAWVLLDPARLAWHDRLSGSRLVLLPKE